MCVGPSLVSALLLTLTFCYYQLALATFWLAGMSGALPWQRVNYDSHLYGILLWDAICACNLVLISFIGSKIYEITVPYPCSLRMLERAAYLLSLTQNPVPFYLNTSGISYPSRSFPIHLSVPEFAVLALNLHFNPTLCSHYNIYGKYGPSSLTTFKELAPTSDEPVFLKRYSGKIVL